MLKILNSRATNAQHRNGAAVRSSPLDRRRHYRSSEEDWAVNGGRGHGEAVNGRDDPTEAIRAMEAELEERIRIEALLNVGHMGRKWNVTWGGNAMSHRADTQCHVVGRKGNVKWGGKAVSHGRKRQCHVGWKCNDMWGRKARSGGVEMNCHVERKCNANWGGNEMS